MVSLHAGEERSGVVSLGRQPARPKPGIERTGSYLAVCKPPRAQANSAKLATRDYSILRGIELGEPVLVFNKVRSTSL